jgi:DeoR family suf operon transcriptional repressor
MMKNMKTTRERILQTLAAHPRSMVNDLAAAVQINGISVRHHLNSLQAEGLVSYEEERHGVGRPRLVYFLTEKGLERFPSRYFRLTNLLLDQLKQSLPEAQFSQIFTGLAANLAAEYAQAGAGLNVEERLNLIQAVLGQEGFEVQWEKQGDQYLIREVTCPYYHVGQSHPEVCAVDQTLISSVLAVPVEKIHCVLRGDAHCTYSIEASAIQEPTL